MTSNIRDARIRLPDDMLRALDVRSGDVSRSMYVRRLIEHDERTGGGVYAAAAESLRPNGTQGIGVVPATEGVDRPSAGVAHTPPRDAVSSGPAEDPEPDPEPEPVNEGRSVEERVEADAALPAPPRRRAPTSGWSVRR